MTVPLSDDVWGIHEFRDGQWRLVAGSIYTPTGGGGGGTPPGPPPVHFGAAAVQASAGGVTVNWVSGHQALDVGLLIVQTCAQPLANLAALLALGWAHAPGSPIMVGTAGTVGAVGLTVLWKRATSGAEPGADIGDSGDHQIGRILVFRGCIADLAVAPFDVGGCSASSVATPSAVISVPGATTTGDNDAIVAIVANAIDTATGQLSGALANASLTSVGPLSSAQSAVGFGGGFDVMRGVLATAGSYGATTGTLAATSLQARLHLALRPPAGDTPPPPPPPGPAPLPFGPYNAVGDLVDSGPGGRRTGAIYNLSCINPHSDSAATVLDLLNRAKNKGIVVFIVTENSPENFMTNGTYDAVKYEANVRKVHDNTTYGPTLAGMFAHNPPQALALIGDECYHKKWGVPSTWTPSLLRDGARLHKNLWPAGVVTVVRVDAHRMKTGWSGQTPSPLLTYWDALDYAVYQYEGPGAQASNTLAAEMVSEKADAAAVNIGVIPAINLVSCGVLTTNVYGLGPCWDYEDSGFSTGIIIGSVPASGYSSGTGYTCAQWLALPTSVKKTVFGSPALLKAMADDAASDPDHAYLPFWPLAGSLATYALQWQARATTIAVMDYMLAACNARASANPLRTPKVYP